MKKQSHYWKAFGLSLFVEYACIIAVIAAVNAGIVELEWKDVVIWLLCAQAWNRSETHALRSMLKRRNDGRRFRPEKVSR